MADFSAKFSSTGAKKVTFSDQTPDLSLKSSAAATRIDNLADVNTSVTSANGSILVYDRTTDTYVQRDILSYDADSGAFKLDGGSF